MARAIRPVAARIRGSGCAFRSQAAAALRQLVSWLTGTGYKPECHYMRGGGLCGERRAGGSWQGRSHGAMSV